MLQQYDYPRSVDAIKLLIYVPMVNFSGLHQQTFSEQVLELDIF